MNMQTVSAQQVAERLPYGQLIDALEAAFQFGATVPDRSHLTVDTGGADGTLLLMPAWRSGGSLGVKIATVFPDNAAKNLGAVHASYFLMDAMTGVPLAILDGTELTLRRTACASALASRYLSRTDAETLLMIGTGNLAPHLIAAHASERDLKQVLIWGRREVAAQELAASLVLSGLEINVVTDLEAAVPGADIISCATLATDPLVSGAWLRAGQHLDLVGAFTPQMHEADGNALKRSRIFVDTYAGAMAESGEIIDALASRLITREDIIADLASLVRAEVVGRKSNDDITLFKSVGTALEDLAAAELAIANG
jgi:alanine dehydrogenase